MHGRVLKVWWRSAQWFWRYIEKSGRGAKNSPPPGRGLKIWIEPVLQEIRPLQIRGNMCRVKWVYDIFFKHCTRNLRIVFACCSGLHEVMHCHVGPPPPIIRTWRSPWVIVRSYTPFNPWVAHLTAVSTSSDCTLSPLVDDTSGGGDLTLCVMTGLGWQLRLRSSDRRAPGGSRHRRRRRAAARSVGCGWWADRPRADLICQLSAFILLCFTLWPWAFHSRLCLPYIIIYACVALWVG